jgi:hypothetical protein
MTGVMLGQGVVLVSLFTVHGHVCPIGGSRCRGWGLPWLLVLPEGSTCPSDETEVHRGVRHSRAYVAGVEQGRTRSQCDTGVGRFDNVMRAQARQKPPPEAPISPETFPQGSGGMEVGSQLRLICCQRL